MWGDAAARFRLLAENTAPPPDGAEAGGREHAIRSGSATRSRCPPDHAFEVWTTRLSSVVAQGPLGLGRPRHARWSSSRASAGASSSARPTAPRSTGARSPRGTRPTGSATSGTSAATAADATDVELTFVDLGDGTTRLDIVHSGWERLGAEGVAWREANTRGWGALVPSFVAAAEA